MFIAGQTVFENDENHTVVVMGNEDKGVWVFDPFSDDLILHQLKDLSYIKQDGKMYLGRYCDYNSDGLTEEFIEANREEISDYLIELDKLVTTDSSFEIV